MQYVLYLSVSLLIILGTAASNAIQIDLVSRRLTNSPSPLGETMGIELSADGNWAAITVSDDTPDQLQFSSDVFLRNVLTGEDRLVSHSATGDRGNDISVAFAISADGRFVLFDSMADNLIAGDDNETTDVFLFDRNSGQLTLVSRSTAGFADGESEPLAMTADGRFVLFESEAGNLVPNDFNESSDIFLFDREAGSITLVT